VDSGDFFLAKYRPDGELHWVACGGSYASDNAYGVGTDAQGNCYVAASVSRDTRLGSTILPTSSSSSILAKYDPMGSLQWVQLCTPLNGSISARSLAVAPNGNCCVAGMFSGTARFGTISIQARAATSAFVAAYDSQGTAEWAYAMGGTSAAYARAAAVDGLGNCYVSGDFYDLAWFGSVPLVGTNTSRMFVAKVASGLPLLSIAHQTGQPEQMDFTLRANKGTSWQIFSTTNWNSWSPVIALTNVQGVTNFSDTGPNVHPRRFYRAVMLD
jgi:hypothetical protein